MTREELIASVDGAAYPLSGEEYAFRDRRTGEIHVMTRQVLTAMDVCSRFRTFDEHVQAVTGTVEGLRGQHEAVRQVLSNLHSRGLMRQGRETLEALTRVDAQVPQAPLFGVAIRTGDRPDRLVRLLSSFSGNEAEFGERRRYLVIDDSRDEAAVAANAKAVAGARDEGLDVTHLKPEAQARLCAEIAGAVPEAASSVEWLIGRGPDDAGQFTGGRVWNLASIATAGRRFLLLDDDMQCSARVASGCGTGGYDFAPDNWAVWFYEDIEQAAQAGSPGGFDPLAEHEAIVGAPIGRALAKSTSLDPSYLRDLDLRQLRDMEPTSPIVSSVSGMYGDPATGSNLWLYTLRGDSFQRLTESRAAYERCRHRRALWRSRQELSFTPMSSITPVGVDGGRLVPPTFPSGRDEDFLFSTVLRALHPGSRAAEFPWAMGHLPEETRPWSHDGRDSPLTPGLNRYLADMFLNLEPHRLAGNAEERCRALGEYLTAHAAQTDTAVVEHLREYMLFVRSDLVRQLQQSLESSEEAPSYWVEDMRDIIELNGRAIVQQNRASLSDMPAQDDAATAQWLREQFRQYGAALMDWPAIMRYCAEHDPAAGYRQ